MCASQSSSRRLAGTPAVAAETLVNSHVTRFRWVGSPGEHRYMVFARASFNPSLLQLDGRAGGLKLLLDLLGLVFRNAFLHGLGRTLDQVLGFLEAAGATVELK